MTTKFVDCYLMRGGTSRGAYFQKKDLPADPSLRDKMLPQSHGLAGSSSDRRTRRREYAHQQGGSGGTFRARRHRPGLYLLAGLCGQGKGGQLADLRQHTDRRRLLRY